jgi:hypothetical protein
MMQTNPNASTPSSEYDDTLVSDIWEPFTTPERETVLQDVMKEDIEKATDEAWE